MNSLSSKYMCIYITMHAHLGVCIYMYVYMYVLLFTLISFYQGNLK